MLKKLIKKKSFCILLGQLRGAKKLRERDDPFFVVRTASSLTEVPLGLQENDFPKILVGSHGRIAEILLRQIFLHHYSKICSAVMQNIGSGKTLSLPLPSAWRKHLADNGIACSAFYCRILLFISTIRQIVIGFAKSIYLFSPFTKHRSPGCPYVVFVSTSQRQLPILGEKSYDIISWYKESIIRKPHIGKIWAQTKVEKEYVAPDDIIVSRSVFPKLGSLSGYVRFFFSNALAFFVSVFGVLMGKWWYGFLYHESVLFNYFCSLSTDQLADDYFFSNSSWFHKPLWAHEAEQKGLSVSLYFYSVNSGKFERFEHKEPDTYGLKIMLWNQFIVWDEEQEGFFKRYRPKASFVKVGYIDNGGLAYNHFRKKRKNILAVFDVTPNRPAYYASFGQAFAIYSEEMNLAFLEDIIKVFNKDTWEILLKLKRSVNNTVISNAFMRKRLNLIEENMVIIDPFIAATSLVENSDAVISMPFSSPSCIAKVKGVSSIYYARSGLIRYTEGHGVPVLKGQVELKKWSESLPFNRIIASHDRKSTSVSQKLAE